MARPGGPKGGIKGGLRKKKAAKRGRKSYSDGDVCEADLKERGAEIQAHYSPKSI